MLASPDPIGTHPKRRAISADTACAFQSAQQLLRTSTIPNVTGSALSDRTRSFAEFPQKNFVSKKNPPFRCHRCSTACPRIRCEPVGQSCRKPPCPPSRYTVAALRSGRGRQFGCPDVFALCRHHLRICPRTESDLTSKASARMGRLDCRRECLLVRVKLACDATEAKRPNLTPYRRVASDRPHLTVPASAPPPIQNIAACLQRFREADCRLGCGWGARIFASPSSSR